MIDTHCHILPALDDGAADEEAALAMARCAVEGGVKTIIATPHMREGDYLNERPRVLEAVDAFRAVLAQKVSSCGSSPARRCISARGCRNASPKGVF
ncbi:MAG: CpsB/CapC family capsule biosynthesis tyrosine phosphatase [Acidobacteriota bacterium]|nr:CpsB/CapC family capsule biosynthesis tyrosine phosphatase [Acidobacteriota bacterium]